MYHLIAKHGYDKASLSKLCDAVGITKPSIYYYFPSKEDILLAVNSAMYTPLTEHEDVLDSTSVEEYRHELLKFGRNSIANFHDDLERHIVLAEIDLLSTRIPALAKQRMSLTSQSTECYERIVAKGVELGALPKTTDVHAAAQCLYIVIAGMSQTIANGDDIDEVGAWEWLVGAITSLTPRATR